MNVPDWFDQMLSDKGISLSPVQAEQFETYYRLLVEWNEKMNLTGITEREAVYEKHFFDSVSLASFVHMAEIGRMADIGSGAGFPSIPLKICFPQMQVLIVDSLNKRIQFLRHLVQALGLSDVTCVHGRAEDVARDRNYRDQYDLISARAVARLNVLNELCLPFAKPDGLFAAMKGSRADEELQEAAASIRELNAELVSVGELELPNEQAERHIVIIRKRGRTPAKYPRKAGLPLKQPIV